MLRSGMICFCGHYKLSARIGYGGSPLQNCTNNYNATLGHDMLCGHYKLSTRIGYGGSPLQNCTNNYNATLGHDMFLWALQTICTNWVRRLTVRASDERPYRIVVFIINTKIPINFLRLIGIVIFIRILFLIHNQN